MNQYVVDKLPVAYNIGHLVSAEGDSMNPDGNYSWLSTSSPKDATFRSVRRFRSPPS